MLRFGIGPHQVCRRGLLRGYSRRQSAGGLHLGPTGRISIKHCGVALTAATTAAIKTAHISIRITGSWGSSASTILNGRKQSWGRTIGKSAIYTMCSSYFRISVIVSRGRPREETLILHQESAGRAQVGIRSEIGLYSRTLYIYFTAT